MSSHLHRYAGECHLGSFKWLRTPQNESCRNVFMTKMSDAQDNAFQNNNSSISAHFRSHQVLETNLNERWLEQESELFLSPALA